MENRGGWRDPEVQEGWSAALMNFGTSVEAEASSYNMLQFLGAAKPSLPAQDRVSVLSRPGPACFPA